MKRSRLTAQLADEAARRGVESAEAPRSTPVAGRDDTGASVDALGRERLTADPLVGADGVRSLVRRAIDRGRPAAATSG